MAPVTYQTPMLQQGYLLERCLALCITDVDRLCLVSTRHTGQHWHRFVRSGLHRERIKEEQPHKGNSSLETRRARCNSWVIHMSIVSGCMSCGADAYSDWEDSFGQRHTSCLHASERQCDHTLCSERSCSRWPYPIDSDHQVSCCAYLYP